MIAADAVEFFLAFFEFESFHHFYLLGVLFFCLRLKLTTEPQKVTTFFDFLIFISWI